MSTRKRRHFTPEQKVAIVRRHLLEKVPVSDLSDEYEISPTVFYHWQKQLFEKGAAAYRRDSDPTLTPTRRIRHLGGVPDHSIGLGVTRLDESRNLYIMEHSGFLKLKLHIDGIPR